MYAQTSGFHLPDNRFLDSGTGLPLVGRLEAVPPVGTASSALEPAIGRALDIIGGLELAIAPGQSVLIKPNFNSPDPHPASADIEFVAAVAQLLLQAGAGRVAVGESSGLPWHPTRAVLDQTGLLARMADIGVPVIVFEEQEWIELDLAERGAVYLPSVRIPAAVAEHDRLVFLPNLKTHRHAGFTMSLKLAVGLMHPDERGALHAAHLDDKVAELALAVRPDLIILDGRAAFVTKGPASGDRVEPGLILTGGDPVSVDVEAVRILQSYRAENRLGGDAWDLPQIRAALDQRIGPWQRRQYVVRRG